MNRTIALPLLGAALLVIVPCQGVAQPTTPFVQAIQQLTRGTDLKVVDATGRSIKGRLENVEADAILLRSGTSTLRLTEEEVRTLSIRRADSVVEGLLLGTGLGIAGGAAAGAALSKHYNEDFIEEGHVWLGAVAGGLAGLAIGSLWDSATRAETEIYRRPTMLTLAPLANARGGRGVVVQFRW